jgi:hypothetical protein
MKEAGVLINLEGEVLYWHLPEDRQSVILPDSPTLWDIIWTNRAYITGFAHSHPGNGWPGPSQMDLTTFKAIEDGIGRNLKWWITSSDHLVVIRRNPDEGEGKPKYLIRKLDTEPSWVRKLRELSGIYV